MDTTTTKMPKRKPSPAPKFPGRRKRVTLPNGDLLVAGDWVSVEGEEGKFRFQYARGNGEITVFGPFFAGMKNSDGDPAPWNTGQWRTFRPGRCFLHTAIVEVAAKVEQTIVDNGGVPYEQMTKPQKLAYQARLRRERMAAAA